MFIIHIGGEGRGGGREKKSPINSFSFVGSQSESLKFPVLVEEGPGVSVWSNK